MKAITTIYASALKRLPLVVEAVAGDTGRQLKVDLADVDVPENATVTLYVKTPANDEIYAAAAADAAGVALIDLPSSALVAGQARMQIQIADTGGNTLTTFPGLLIVADNIVNGSAIEGNDEYTGLEKLESLQAAVADAVEAVATKADQAALERLLVYTDHTFETSYDFAAQFSQTGYNVDTPGSGYVAVSVTPLVAGSNYGRINTAVSYDFLVNRTTVRIFYINMNSGALSGMTLGARVLWMHTGTEVQNVQSTEIMEGQ